MRNGHDKIVQLICEQTDPDITVHVSMYMYMYSGIYMFMYPMDEQVDMQCIAVA